ncbi:MAG: putative molybdenum cofactor biosynthesis protein, partial [Pseudomonadota bacterium]
MSERHIIPITDHGLARRLLPQVPGSSALPADGLLLDQLGRPLRDLRISVTDRCNFRCS